MNPNDWAVADLPTQTAIKELRRDADELQKGDIK